MADKEEKGFRVIDKRRIGREDAPEEKNEVPTVEKGDKGETPPADKGEKGKTFDRTPQEKEAGESFSKTDRAPGEIEPTFSDLVKSFFFQALASLGMLEGEGMKPGEQNLDAARQFIDILGLLEEKTKGNLSEEEDMLLREYLSQLRMVYVKLAKEKTN